MEKMSAEDQKWRGREAARTLAEAEKIKSDPTLSKLAAREAQALAKEHKASADAMARVAKRTSKSSTTAAKKSTTSRATRRK